MSRRLFLAVSPGEIWAALEEDGELEALRLMRTGAPCRVGEIFLGRVVALRPELPAALVDVGLDRPGFLDMRDANFQGGIADLTEGQALIVEVKKEARADKAVGLGVPRARGAKRERIETAARMANPPARLDEAQTPLAALLGGFLDGRPDRIVIDDRAAFAEARAFFTRKEPAFVPRLVLHTEETPLFEAVGLAGALESVLGERVELPCSGALYIEPTHACTMIDVDSGRASALAANLEAAWEAARQIRLRNLTGPIVIDFVGLKKRLARDRVLSTLEAAFGADPEKPEILGWTRLGHVELVRRRRTAPLADILFERGADGSLRKTALTLALDILRAAKREARAQPGKALAVVVHPEIAAVLMEGEGGMARRALETRLGLELHIEAEPQRGRDTFDIRAR